MNTKIKQTGKKNQGQKSRQEQARKKRGQSPSVLHEQEHPETRMFR